MTFQEAIVQALIIEAKAIEVEVESMKAHDRHAQLAGTGLYAEEVYLAKATALTVISTEIQKIARSGGLS